VRAAREANAAMPAYTVDLATAAHGGSLAGATVLVLGAAYRGGVKETAFSGVFSTVEAIRAAGATPVVHDPLYTDDELAALGLTAWHTGDPADVVILQADHAEYAALSAEDFPDAKVVVDGRRILDPVNFVGPTFLVVGRAGEEN